MLKLLVDEVKGYVKVRVATSLARTTHAHGFSCIPHWYSESCRRDLLSPPRGAASCTRQMFNLGTTCYGAGVMGVAVFSLFFSFLHLKHLIGFSNFLVWWLCVAGWVLTGLTYIVYVFGRDLCSAYENVSDAGNVKALLPCVSDSDGQRALNSTYFAINDAVQQANLVLFQAYNATNTTQAASAAYLCNPTARNGSMFVRTSCAPPPSPISTPGADSPQHLCVTAPGRGVGRVKWACALMILESICPECGCCV